MSKIHAVRLLKEEAGFSLADGMQAVRLLLELAKEGRPLAGDTLLGGYKGAVEVSRVYTALEA